MLATLIPLISALGGAIATSISKALVDRIGARQLTVLTFVGVAVIMAPFAPLFFHVEQLAVFVPFFLLIIATDAVGNLLFFTALSGEDVSKVTALAAMSPLFTAILAPLLLPAHFGPGVFIATIAIVLSLYVIETGELVDPVNDLQRRETLYVLVSAMLFGFSAIPMRYLLTEWSLVNAPTLYWLRGIAIAAVLLAVLRPDFSHIDRRTYGIIGFKCVFVVSQWVLMLYALARFNVITTKALSQFIPVFVFFIATEELGEAFNLHRLVGILLIVASTVAIHVLGLAV
ncbi:MAG: DMT family transporter [Candidatus Nanohaloarchaea archaeon]|nr:DMT family transporter [Candidatus Nanohaloarchaea archaeon]